MQKIEPGVGRVVLRSHGPDAVFSELSYKYPLKLLSPQTHAHKTAVLYVVSYGGGLVGGDSVELTVEVLDESVLVMLTQVSVMCFLLQNNTHICVWQSIFNRDLPKCSKHVLENVLLVHIRLTKPI